MSAPTVPSRLPRGGLWVDLPRRTPFLGLSPRFYFGADASGELLGEAATSKALLPGQSEQVELEVPVAGKKAPYAFYVTVDGSPGAIDECLEDNNDASIGNVTCPMLN